VRPGGAIDVFRTERNNNLDARSALRLSRLDRCESEDYRVSQPVTVRHKVSHSVTSVTPSVCRQAIQISSLLHGRMRNRQHGMTSAVAAVASDI
jgi:hypothetical protein